MDDQRAAIRADLDDLFRQSKQARRRSRVMMLALSLAVVVALLAVASLPRGLLW